MVIILLVTFLTASNPVSAEDENLKQLWSGGYPAHFYSDETFYTRVDHTSWVYMTTESPRTQSQIATPGTIGELKVYSTENAYSGSQSFTLMKNGVATSLTCTISAGENFASDVTHSVTVAAGDKVSLKTTPVSGYSFDDVGIFWTLVFTSDDAYSSNIMGSGYPGYTNTTTYCGISATDYITGGNTPAIHLSIMPTSGTISDFYVTQSGASGLGKTWTYTLYKASSTNTGITVSIAGSSATSGSDTAHSYDVSAGDRIYIRVTPTSTPTARYFSWGIKFTADNAGESVILGSSQNIPQSSTRYSHDIGKSSAYTSTTNCSTAYSARFCTGYTLSDLYVGSTEIGTSAGTHAWATLVCDTQDTSLNVALPNLTVYTADTTDSFAIPTDGSILNLKLEIDDYFTTGTYFYWGMVMLYEPPSGWNYNFIIDEASINDIIGILKANIGKVVDITIQ